MSVLDASVVADALVRREEPSPVTLPALAGRVDAPSIFPAEVTSALRGLLFAGQISEQVADAARKRLAIVRVRLHPYAPYADRVWELRSYLTIYDAWYVAVAERLEQPLVTADAAILGAPGLRCELMDAR